MMDDFITEELPYGAVLLVHADEGQTVFYVDIGLGIRTHTIGKSRRWFPNFMVARVDDAMLEVLKTALRRECPDAEKYRHIKMPSAFFLYAIR